ncbi:hypothetical protein MKX08_010680 [Trichoderma sp. CBMAI-0020]|nr:hypothetical protein MKX08_010680 [Trichoderma sp. CBMAI-0020]
MGRTKQVLAHKPKERRRQQRDKRRHDSPPNAKTCFEINIKDIKVSGRKLIKISFEKGTDDWKDAVACISMYQRQVTALSTEDRKLMQDIILTGRFTQGKSARENMTNHILYRKWKENRFSMAELQWPAYLILRAIIQYLMQVKKKWGTLDTPDHSRDSLKLHSDVTEYQETSSGSDTEGTVIIDLKRKSGEEDTPPSTSKRARTRKKSKQDKVEQDITEMKQDITKMKQDITEMGQEITEMKQDIKQIQRLLKIRNQAEQARDEEIGAVTTDQNKLLRKLTEALGKQTQLIKERLGRLENK